MHKLLVMAPNPTDATSFYRAVGPLSVLEKQCAGDLAVIYCERVTWANFHSADAIFVQRPYKPVHFEAIQMAKSAGLPVWVDYDDDLFSVPTDNPSFNLYNSKATAKAMIDCLRAADIVTVTTPALRSKIEKVNPNVLVIPNAFNDLIFQRPKIKRFRNPLVLWRGSATHTRDLMSFATPIEQAFKAFPEWTWNFMGYNPWFITDVLDSQRCIATEPIDVMEYFGFLGKVQAAVQMVPLHDSPFNRAKSNIAMIEGAFAGSVTLAPAWEEWNVPGVLQYKNQKEFAELLKLALSDGKFPFYENSKLTWEWVMEERRLSKVNKWRFDVLQELFDRSPKPQTFGAFRV